MLEIGSIVDGKYKVLNKIGQGGMSVVYLAMNERANKQWAIKEVRKDGVKDFDIVKQGLVVETDMLKKLNHSYLPSIVDVIDQTDNFLIVMDYIEGNPLSQKIEEYGAQPQELVIKWAKQLCDVLGYLHTRKPAIIYRDMKPANVMLKPDGNITLIDFGTAREYKDRNIADTTCLGTVGYAAPEQFGGQGQTDARTDIYCLGATLYHLVTGMNPSEPPYEMKPIRQINPILSNGLEKIILKCTQRNPDDRYQSCSELMYALEHYDEIDDSYRKKQKRKLGVFFLSIILSLSCLGTGIAAQSMAKKRNQKEYEDVLKEANNFLYVNKDYDGTYEWMDRYKDAISIKPNDTSAYFDLLDAITDEKSDGSENVITDYEYTRLIDIIETYSDSLKSNKNDYSQVMYQVGYKCFMYFDYGSGEKSDNMKTRLSAANKYFKEVSHDSSEYEKALMYMHIYEYAYEVNKSVEKNDKLPDDFDELFSNYNSYIEDIAMQKADITPTNVANFTKLYASTTSQHCKKIVKLSDETVDKLKKTLENIDIISEYLKEQRNSYMDSDAKYEFFDNSIDNIDNSCEQIRKTMSN